MQDDLFGSSPSLDTIARERTCQSEMDWLTPGHIAGAPLELAFGKEPLLEARNLEMTSVFVARGELPLLQGDPPATAGSRVPGLPGHVIPP